MLYRDQRRAKAAQVAFDVGFERARCRIRAGSVSDSSGLGVRFEPVGMWESGTEAGDRKRGYLNEW